GDIQAAIIDLDGTMIDTVGDFVVALNATLTDLSLPQIDHVFVRRPVGKGTEHLIERTLAHIGAAPSLYDDVLQRYQQHYLRINGQHSMVFPGVIGGLEGLLSLGLRLACLTNKPTAFTEPLLAAKCVANFFTVVFGGDAFARKKPDPLPLLKACEALGTIPAQD